MIALLCPTRNRESQFKRMWDSANKTASKDVPIWLYSCSNGNDSYTFHAPLDCSTVYMWNNLAKLALSDFDKNIRLFMLSSDDTIFSTPNWNKAMLDHYAQLEDKIHVYALQDSRDPEGTPHPIVTREYIDAMGYFVPPIFLHWFVDTWTVQIAKANNCFTHLKDFELIHDKPSDKGLGDETHNHIRRMGWHARDKYVNDTCQHFLEVEKSRLGLAMRK